jgi:hypothetical protein
MARRFLHLVMLVMAFQLSWNVVTAYCMHETGRAADHLGHHRHEPSSDELAAADRHDGAQQKGVHDAHCVSCAHIALAAPDLLDGPFAPGGAGRLRVGQAIAPSSVFSSPPERPQWPVRA